MTESRIWAGGLLAILLLALMCCWVHYTPETAANTPAIATTTPGAGTVTPPAPAANTAAIAPSAASALPLLNLRSESKDGVVTLTGDVPSDAAKAAIIERATRIYGAGKVIDKLRVDSSGKPEGFDRFAAEFPPDLRDSTNALAYAQTGRLVLEGEVPSASAKASIEENAARSYSPGLKIDSRLIVKAPPQSAPQSVPPSAPQTAAAPTQAPAQAPKQTAPDKPGELRATINFTTSSAVLTKKAKVLLRGLARDLKSPDSRSPVTLAGFTDSRGSDASNLKLSERRALSVKAYLTKLGVSPDRLSTEAKGSAEPVGENDNVEGRRQNRRVEVRFP